MSRLPPPPPGFSLDDDEDEDESPPAPPPPGFKLDSAQAVDGDTIRSMDTRVRLWGVDAPELNQPGYDRLGRPVPIGQQARDWLRGEIANAGSVNLGNIAGSSYGRLVGPITLDGQDAGVGAVRSGNALAAPSYVRDDPAYRFKLMEAERLARMNGLGPMNDTLAQNPAAHRLDPNWKPERETVAQFWDTPTPFAGMRPEAEREYLGLTANGTAEQIVQFLTAQGMGVDAKEATKWVKWRDDQKAQGKPFQNYVNYQRGPEIIQELGDGAGGAGVRGFAEGFVAGGLGELGAVADTLGGTQGRENVWNSDRRLADIWANNEWQNESILRGDDAAHPTASTVGNVAGALTSGFVIPYGAGARTIPQLAKVGGVYGGAEGFLGTDGGVPERLQGAVIGAPVGAAVNAVGGKAIEFAAPVLARGVAALRGRLRGNPVDEAMRVHEATGGPLEETADEWPGNVVEPAPGGDDATRAEGTIPGQGVTPARASREADFAARLGGDDSLRFDGQTPTPAAVPTARTMGMEAEQAPALSVGPPTSREEFLEREAAMGERAAQAYRETLRRGMASDPELGPEDYPPFSDFLAEWRDREAAALSGNAAAKQTIEGLLPDGGQSLFGQRARPLLDPATNAERIAAAQRVQPGDVLPMPSNVLDGVEEAAAADASRYAPAKAPNERAELSKGMVRNFSGVPVPKVGPTDMVGWLRLRGGLQDSGGELKGLGLTNAARRGLDHVGQEARFGPLVNDDSGARLDEAALSAWEAGFFPELTERPTINQFLDALRDTYHGDTGRRFAVDDYAELERFEAMRSERFGIEQQEYEAGGPVWQDRSNPADAPQPFPSLQAYEEWPSDAIQRVGNVDVTKLDTPQDIRRALRTSYNAMGGFDAATRGRITQAETANLAADLGMTADALLARRKGQAFNAEEALAARQILAKSGNELVNLAKRVQALENPGDEQGAAFQRALVRHAAIQEQVSGATAEAGRALSQFRMMAESRRVPGEVLAGIVDARGGPKRVKDAANLILEAIEGPPGRFNSQVRKAANPRFSDKLAELYINNLLSGPQTHVVNTVSNTMTSISQIPENAVAAAFGGARRVVARREVGRVMAGELGARLFGLIQGTKEGAHLFAQALRTGETSDTFSKIAGHDMRAISGVKGEIVRIPGRLLNSADEFFKGMNRRAEINALAYRQAHREGLSGEALQARIADLSANPTEEIELRGLDFARYMTFQRPLAGLGATASRIAREYPLMRPIITFVRTPVNLLKFATERSPAAPLLKEWRDDIKAGGAQRDLALARVALGTGFATMFYNLALEGKVTGSAPTDAAKNRFMRADGWQPYSVRIGDQWVSYSRLDPFAVQLGVAADLAIKAQGMSNKQLDNYAMLMVASVMKQMADKTWLSGVTEFSTAMSDPERYGPRYLRNLGASLVVPNALGQTARAIDPVSRERETFGEELQARIPGLKDNLLPSRDIWGKPITAEDRVGPDVLNPFQQSSVRSDPVNAEMLKLGARKGPPQKAYTLEGRKVDWTPEQYDRLQELAGKASYEGVAQLMASPSWKRMTAPTRVKAIDKVFRDARAEAKGAVLGLIADKATRPAERREGVPPPPPGFTIEGESAGLNVFRDLQEAIPGIKFTSGYRDYGYNQKLKARGYNAADDSTHQDGDTFDMLPPPGKTLPWLRVQVKRRYPKAELLVHDGHLHGRFPGYYGAPAIGGAKSAGLRNPLAGIPPPPAGFTIQ